MLLYIKHPKAFLNLSGIGCNINDYIYVIIKKHFISANIFNKSQLSGETKPNGVTSLIIVYKLSHQHIKYIGV